MDLTDKIENYINSKNRVIWEEVKSKYHFKLVLDLSEFSWASKVEGNFATIVTPHLNIDFDSFTHELLHVYFDFLGLTPYPTLIHTTNSLNSLGILVIESELISHLYNVCSHKKMFTVYKELGFSEYNFVDARISFNDNDVNYIRNGFSSTGKQSEYIHQFIGHTLSLMNNVVEEDKTRCSKYLSILKSVNPELFEIVYNFDKSWENATDLDLLKFYSLFDQELDNWLVNNNLTFDNDYFK